MTPHTKNNQTYIGRRTEWRNSDIWQNQIL